RRRQQPGVEAGDDLRLGRQLDAEQVLQGADVDRQDGGAAALDVGRLQGGELAVGVLADQLVERDPAVAAGVVEGELELGVQVNAAVLDARPQEADAEPGVQVGHIDVGGQVQRPGPDEEAVQPAQAAAQVDAEGEVEVAQDMDVARGPDVEVEAELRRV